jgi:acetyltransferase-like isoleucine patch superfamily enzyme
MNILDFIFLFFSNIRLYFFKVIYVGRFKAPLSLLSLCFPSLRIRNKGKVEIGKIKCRFGCNFFSDGGRITIGDGTFFNNYCSVNSRYRVVIGCNSLLGEGVKIYDHNHKINVDNTVSKTEFVTSSVIIGDDCWIGSNSIILPGVEICNNVTIGAGTVVTKSIVEAGVYVSSGNKLRKL